MRTLIVGVGAVGGVMATRALAAGIPVCLATRTEETARRLRSGGLQVSGIGGVGEGTPDYVSTLEGYKKEGKFDLIVIATKAHDALVVAPTLVDLLSPGGTMLPVQNGAVSQALSENLGPDIILGGLSNLGATMKEPGVYEQTNRGHIMIGEVRGGVSERASRVGRALGKAVEMRVSTNIVGAIWSKLLVNCAVTTLGAVSSLTMRKYIESDVGKRAFSRTYEEALSVALAAGVRPERMLVEPIPPNRGGEDYDEWVWRLVASYGDVKPSMAQDLERGRKTEIDFINGYVVKIGAMLGVPTPMNSAIVELVHLLEQGLRQPEVTMLEALAGIPG